MARLLTKRLRLIGALTTLAPLSIGSADTTHREDISVMRNGAGEIYIPGTSLAGAIRTLIDDNNVGFWGGAGDNDVASVVSFHDCVLQTGRTEVRDGVGIDRLEGRAAERVKYDREVVISGATFKFAAEVEIISDDDPAEKLLKNIRWLLESGRLRLGGSVSRGLGKVKLVDCRGEKLPLDDTAAFLSALKKGNWTTTILNAQEPDNLPALLTVEINWSPLGAIMVKAGEDGAVVDTIPLVTAVGENNQEKWRQTIPGAGTKGVFRSHSERIMRTMTGTASSLKEEKDTQNSFLEMVKCDPLVNALYGSARPDDEDGTASRMGNNFGRSALAVEETLTEGTISPELQNVLRGIGTHRAARDLSKLTDRLKEEPENHSAWPDTQAAMHVVIDRWTGGAAPNLLFSRLEPLRPEFRPIVMEIDCDRLAFASDNPLPAFALFLITMRSFMQGALPLGFGGNRGLGAVEVSCVRFSLDGIVEDESFAKALNYLCQNPLDETMWSSPEFIEAMKPVTKAWEEWITSWEADAA